MDLWIVLLGEDYEGTTLLGVFSSKERAEQFAETQRPELYETEDILIREVKLDVPQAVL